MSTLKFEELSFFLTVDLRLELRGSYSRNSVKNLEVKRLRLQVSYYIDGFGGLMVIMLASGTQVCGFKPGRSRWIFTSVKILSMPSSGGEVKESVPCPSFAVFKRT